MKHNVLGVKRGFAIGAAAAMVLGFVALLASLCGKKRGRATA